MAREAAEAQRLLAAGLRGAELPTPLPTPPDIEVDPDDVTAVLLRHAADVAHAAVASLTPPRGLSTGGDTQPRECRSASRCRSTASIAGPAAAPCTMTDNSTVNAVVEMSPNDAPR